MISVIVPTLNSDATLPACLSALIPGVVDGLVREVIIADGGSADQTLMIADASGATTVSAAATRSDRLIGGAERAKFPWLLFLPPDGVLGASWLRDAETAITKNDSGAWPSTAAVFRMEIDDRGVGPRCVEAIAALGHGVLGLAGGANGLLISRLHYERVGGFRPLSGLESLDLAWRIGRRNLVAMRTPLVTSAARYRASGYAAAIAHDGTELAKFAIKTALGQRPAAGKAPSIEAAGH